MTTEKAKYKIAVTLQATDFGAKHINYKLRDWLFSRQRYWGEPFPIVYDKWGHVHALPESMLPVVLPKMENFQPEASNDPLAPPRPPLARAKEWMKVSLDLYGNGTEEYTRESNTMPNWAGSCWYYLRYLDPENTQALVGKEAERYWMTSKKSDGTPHMGGVELYVGAVGHAVLHLLYARFWHKVLFDLGHVSTPEPFGKLFNQGYVQAFAYADSREMYVPAEEVVEGEESRVSVDELKLPSGEVEPVYRATKFHWTSPEGERLPVFQEYGKMGKSLKNAVTPDEVCAQYGGDTLRIYEMSMGPLEASKPWNTRDIAGSYRFLQRVWRLMIDEQTGNPRVSDDVPDTASLRSLHKAIGGVRRDMVALGFNTAISKLIELTNELTKQYADKPLPRGIAEPLVLMLAPFAPHMAEELWAKLGHSSSVVYAPFPVVDESLAADSEVELPVQINGKLRGKITVAAGLDKAALESIAAAHPSVQALLEGKPYKKLIAVPGKMVSIVM